MISSLKSSPNGCERAVKGCERAVKGCERAVKGRASGRVPRRPWRPHAHSDAPPASVWQVARSTDHNPKTTTYLWHVEVKQAYAKLESEMLQVDRRSAHQCIAGRCVRVS